MEVVRIMQNYTQLRLLSSGWDNHALNQERGLWGITQIDKFVQGSIEDVRHGKSIHLRVC